MRFRRRRPQALLDLSALDRLGELVGRIVALLPEQPVAQEPQPPPTVVSAPASVPVPRPVPRNQVEPAEPPPPEQAQPAESAESPAVLLLLATASGYRLLEGGEVEATPGSRVELADGRFRVLRIGPSPFPGDRRRCAYLEREEPSAEARTPDG